MLLVARRGASELPALSLVLREWKGLPLGRGRLPEEGWPMLWDGRGRDQKLQGLLVDLR